MTFIRILSLIIASNVLLGIVFSQTCDAKSRKSTQAQAEETKKLDEKNLEQQAMENSNLDPLSTKQSLKDQKSPSPALDATGKVNPNPSQAPAAPLPSTPRGRIIVVPQK